MSSADRPPLEQLLGKAVRSPSHVYSNDGGAVLALSLHCEFIFKRARIPNSDSRVLPPVPLSRRLVCAVGVQERPCPGIHTTEGLEP